MLRVAMLTALIATGSAAQQPPPAQGSRLTEPRLVAALGAHLDSLAAADRFSGVVLVARGDTHVFQGAFGMADREAAVPNALDTRFNLGSINKVFTAIAIRKLAGAGMLALTDRLIRHLPDYPNRDAAERVTIEQLLNHTSGIGETSSPHRPADRATTCAARRISSHCSPMSRCSSSRAPPAVLQRRVCRARRRDRARVGNELLRLRAG
jgi:CubicO group peptidase (beta-lactamase class C family)